MIAIIKEDIFKLFLFIIHFRKQRKIGPFGCQIIFFLLYFSFIMADTLPLTNEEAEAYTAVRDPATKVIC